MAPRPPHRQRRSAAVSLRALSLLIALLQPAARGQAEPPREDDFGRWERRAEGCRIRLLEGPTPQTFSCRSLRLDQQMAGLLSIRFLAEGSATTPQLVFAGVLQPGSRPMRCREGSCTPQLPLRVQVSAMASGSVGGLLTPPRARVAQGSCSLQGRQVSCEARDGDGGSWKAETRW